MTERIMTRDAAGNLVPRQGSRRPGGVYSDIGKDKDGVVILREWTAAEIAERAAEVVQRPSQPAPDLRAEIESLKARVAALEGGRFAP